MPKLQKIALIPAYEPSRTLTELAARLRETGFLLVVIDDGSGKDCGPIFEEVSRLGTVLTHPENRGKGCAIKTALSYIRERFSEDAVIVTLDADGQHLVSDVVRVCEEALKNPGCLVLGSRGFRGDVPARSRFGNTMTRLVFRASTGVGVRDTQTGLRAFGSELIPFLQSVEGSRYEYEMNVLLRCARQKIPIREVEIETIYFDRNAGSHFNTFRDSFRVYRNILKFTASSLMGFLTDYGLYSLLIVLTGGLGTAVSVPLSNVVARTVSASLNFAVNRRYVFQSDASLIRTGTQYFALAAGILCGNTLLLSFLVERLGINRFAAKLVTEVTFFLFSWLAQRFLIFKKRVAAENHERNLNNAGSRPERAGGGSAGENR